MFCWFVFFVAFLGLANWMWRQTPFLPCPVRLFEDRQIDSISSRSIADICREKMEHGQIRGRMVADRERQFPVHREAGGNTQF